MGEVHIVIEWVFNIVIMYGAQHEFFLDDRDVTDYNKDRKFEQFVHLGQNIQKLIVFSFSYRNSEKH